MTLVLLFLLKIKELIQNGLQPYSGVTIVFNENNVASIIAELL